MGWFENSSNWIERIDRNNLPLSVRDLTGHDRDYPVWQCFQSWADEFDQKAAIFIRFSLEQYGMSEKFYVAERWFPEKALPWTEDPDCELEPWEQVDRLYRDVRESLEVIYPRFLKDFDEAARRNAEVLHGREEGIADPNKPRQAGKTVQAGDAGDPDQAAWQPHDPGPVPEWLTSKRLLVRSRNEANLKAAGEGDGLIFYQREGWLFVGPGHNERILAWAAGGTSGTITVISRGFLSSPGEIEVSGAEDRDAFKQAIREFSKKKITFK
jgi:hypothetical protein